MVCERQNLFCLVRDEITPIPQTTFSSSSHRLGTAKRGVRTRHICFYRSAAIEEIPFQILTLQSNLHPLNPVYLKVSLTKPFCLSCST